MNEKTKIKNRERAKIFYWNNKDNILNKMKKYQQTEDGKLAKQKAYHNYIRTTKSRTNRRLYRTHLKVIALQIYSSGTMRCAKCGFDDIDCLDLDHLDNKGYVLRKQIGYHRGIHEWVHANNYPPNFQVLCRNCNWKKYMKSKGVNYL